MASYEELKATNFSGSQFNVTCPHCLHVYKGIAGKKKDQELDCSCGKKFTVTY